MAASDPNRPVSGEVRTTVYIPTQAVDRSIPHNFHPSIPTTNRFGDEYVGPTAEVEEAPPLLELEELAEIARQVIPEETLLDAELTISPLDRVRFLYRLVPEHLQTDLIRTAIRINDLYGFFETLTPEDFRTRPEVIWANTQELYNLTYKSVGYYTRNNHHPATALEKALNMARQGKNALLIRIDYDIASLNKLDPSGALADKVVDYFDEWYTELEIDPVAWNTFGDNTPAYAQMMDRTAWMVVGPNSEEGNALLDYIIYQQAYAEDDVKKMLRTAQSNGEIPPPAQLNVEEVALRATIHHDTLHLKDFMSGYAGEHSLRSYAEVPRFEIVKQIIREMSRVTAQTAYLKSNPPPEGVGAWIDHHIYIYGPDALPTSAEPEAYATLQGDIAIGKKFVPFGLYGPGMDIQDPELRAQALNIDFRHAIGFLYRHPKFEGDGGAIERSAYLFDSMRKDGVTTAQVAEFLQNIRFIAQHDLNMLEMGRRDVVNSFVMTPSEALTQVAIYSAYYGIPYDIMHAEEIDDGNALTTTYPEKIDDPVNGMVDAKFQKMKTAPHRGAERMSANISAMATSTVASPALHTSGIRLATPQEVLALSSGMLLDGRSVETILHHSPNISPLKTGLYPVVVTATGDQILSVSSSHLRDGTVMNKRFFAESLARETQLAFGEMMGEYPVQPSTKVETVTGVQRTKLYYGDALAMLTGDIERVVPALQPTANMPPFLKPVSLTITATDAPDISSLIAPEIFRFRSLQLFQQVDDLKKADYLKGRYAVLPGSFGTVASTKSDLSQLPPEYLKLLGQESIPLESFKPEPMITPILEPGKFDGQESIRPVRIGSIGTLTGDGYIFQPEGKKILPPPEPMIFPATPPKISNTFAFDGNDGTITVGVLGDAAIIASTQMKMPSIPVEMSGFRTGYSTAGFGGLAFPIVEKAVLWGMGLYLDKIKLPNDKIIEPFINNLLPETDYALKVPSGIEWAIDGILNPLISAWQFVDKELEEAVTNNPPSFYDSETT